MATRVWRVLTTVALLFGMSTNGWAYKNAGFKSEAEAQEYYRRQRDTKHRERVRQLAVFDEAIVRDPQDAVAHYQRARFRCQPESRDLKLALADFDAAIRLKPDFSQAYFRRGLVYANLNDYVRCAADLEEALHLDSSPSSQKIRYRLAMLYHVASDESVRDLVKARKIAEGLEIVELQRHPHCELLAAICADLGDFDAAVRWETRRWEGQPADIGGRSHLAAYQRGEIIPEVRCRLRDQLHVIPYD